MTAGTPVWRTRPLGDDDAAAVRVVLDAAFPSAQESVLVDALRADPAAWLPGLSAVTVDADGDVVALAVLSRCHVGAHPALALGPCATRPAEQGRGAGAAAIRAALDAAREAHEGLVVVLGHAGYYPRFGFERASRVGIRSPLEVPDEAFMALSLDASQAVPPGVVLYADAFGV